MFGPPSRPSLRCTACGHRFDEHDLGECGCQLPCTVQRHDGAQVVICTCTDFQFFVGATDD